MEFRIEDVHRHFARGSLSCRELVAAYLERIEAYDRHGPCLNAILTLNPAALETAEALDRAYASGRPSGRLHGIPIVLKDNFNTSDLPTTGGSAALSTLRPRADAFVVSRLRQAGALILAKTNLHEFAVAGMTASSLGGQTLNPYDLTRTPGGSSGGTAVAVSANMAVAGTGTDTLNSIRSPASANALVGIRPTRGLVSRTGIMPVAETQDTVGPMARSVADACRLLEVMAGADPADVSTSVLVPPESYRSSLVPGGLKGTRIGIARGLFGKQTIHQCVNDRMARALDVMQAEGGILIDIDDPELESERLIHDLDVQNYELREELNAYLASIPDASLKTLSDILASGQCREPSAAAALRAAERVARGTEEPEYQQRLQRRAQFRQHLLRIFNRHRLHAIAYPLQKRLVVSIGEPDQADRNGVVAAVTGFPAITVPIGFSPPTPTAPIGIPIGMDLLGRPSSETLLIGVAYAFESAAAARRPPPSTPPLT